jgi:hypothetical protein
MALRRPATILIPTAIRRTRARPSRWTLGLVSTTTAASTIADTGPTMGITVDTGAPIMEIVDSKTAVAADIADGGRQLS